jgi:hypothetical protein
LGRFFGRRSTLREKAACLGGRQVADHCNLTAFDYGNARRVKLLA